MANKYFKDHVKTYESGIVKLFGKVVTSTSGAIDSQSCKGFSVAKTGSETGRYTVTLEDQYTSLAGLSVALVGADDAAYTTANGVQWFLRNVDVTASSPSFDVQFVRTDTGADAEVIDAAEFYLEISLKNTSAF